MGTVLNGLRLRRRLSGLLPLTAPTQARGSALIAPPESGGAASTSNDAFELFCAPGVEVSDAVRFDAELYANAEDLDVVELVPADLSPDQVLDLARGVNTRSYRSSALALGRGAGHAVLVRSEVADRAETAALEDRAGFISLIERLKQYAARSTDLAVTPGVAAVDSPAEKRLGELRALYGSATPLALAVPAAKSSLLAAGMVLSPGWGVMALAATIAQPYLVAGRTPLRPPRSAEAAIGRLIGPFALVRPLLAGNRAGDGDQTPDPVDARRAGYTSALAEGTERFFEPRRDTCPWCGGAALVERFRTPDLLQAKPGEFVVEQCSACGLVFQNPRLSIDGLDFYYRDFYDGLGAGGAQFLFAHSLPSYRGRVALARRHGTPRAWLDVGSGYGHFCVVAKGMLPDTRFEGLDMGSSIEQAELRGWIDRSYRGLFPDLAEQLAGRFDVVSMHHYLEHTRDPRAELAAARVALEPGGHLLIEVPDPESRFGRLFGRYWVPWLQPQHQQFLSVALLTAALEAEGFSIVEVERGPAHQPIDIAGAVGLRATDTAPAARVPWRDPPTPSEQVMLGAVLAAAAPFALAAMVADRALQPIIRAMGAGWSNTYRVLAVRP